MQYSITLIEAPSPLFGGLLRFGCMGSAPLVSENLGSNLLGFGSLGSTNNEWLSGLD